MEKKKGKKKKSARVGRGRCHELESNSSNSLSSPLSRLPFFFFFHVELIKRFPYPRAWRISISPLSKQKLAKGERIYGILEIRIGESKHVGRREWNLWSFITGGVMHCPLRGRVFLQLFRIERSLWDITRCKIAGM